MGLIKLEHKFSDKTTAEQIEYLHKLASSLNDGLDQMQTERNVLRDRVIEMERLNRECQKAFDQQKAINHTLITQNNERKESDGQRLIELKRKLVAAGVK